MRVRLGAILENTYEIPDLIFGAVENGESLVTVTKHSTFYFCKCQTFAEVKLIEGLGCSTLVWYGDYLEWSWPTIMSVHTDDRELGI